MEKGIAHIKKVFRGDEQFLMLQTYYRINHYHPIYILKSFIPLALQVPFFIAAYHFISNLDFLVGASFSPIIDLNKPDRLLSVFGIELNILPVVMTIINIISSSVYAKNHTVREKIQLYGTSLVFLALLYNSPSGLVLYWTYNNIFSLVRNIIDNSKNNIFFKGAVFSGLAAFFLMTALMSTLINGEYHIWAYAVSISFLIAAFSKPLGEPINKWKKIIPSFSLSSRWFFSGSLLLTFLVGILIPTEVIKSSPAEFVNLSAFKSPLLYVADSVAIAAGLFILWLGFFYYLSTPRKMTKIFNILILVLCGIAIINYLFFGTNLGTITEFFQYEQTPTFSKSELITNFACMIATASVLIIIWRTSEKTLRMIASVMVVVIIGMCGLNFSSITSSLNKRFIKTN